jgi:FixJ family two-component response regulator
MWKNSSAKFVHPDSVQAMPRGPSYRGFIMAKAVPAVIVYIVDDDDAVRCAFARLLQSAGLDPRPYESPERFLREVVDGQHACILLDITMPKMTGPQVQMLLQERSIALPVIAVSARDDEETRKWARGLGAKMFLRKPVDDQAMLDAISWVTQSSHSD